MVARALLIALLCALGSVAQATTSDAFRSERVTARLLAAEDAIAPGARTVSAGLHVDLTGDWKTYWRTPGEVGLAPEIDWSASENVADARMLFPAPTRFRAFGIENFGYKDEVVFPIEIVLRDPGRPARLRGSVTLLVCETICVPEAFGLSLDLPAGDGDASVDRKAATLIARYAERVPERAPVEAQASLEADRLVVAIRPAFDAVPTTLDLFPEFEGGAFGPPDIRADASGSVWGSFPIVREPVASEGAITLAGSLAPITVPVALGDTAPLAPEGATAFSVEPSATASASAFAMLGLAFVGGLILNAMPCVLPVLSLKLAGAAKLRAADARRVRGGFLATAAGILAFVLVLAILLLVLRGFSVAVGWGVQFQAPVFLATVVAILVLFGLNLLGVFEIALPERVNTWIGARGGSGYAGDFATGAFAALLATPCSAPFLGTAVAFALAGSAVQLLGIFVLLGLGLAAPYLLVAAVPRAVALLPAPGPWMVALRRILGVLLLGTAVWFVSILAASVGVVVAGVALALALAGALVIRDRDRPIVRALGAIALLLAIAVPTLLAREPEIALASDRSEFVWEPFDRAAIAPAVARGEVVFVDVTADWCLTCKANKASTLSRGPVADRLAAEDVRALRADWTRPNDDIRRYLNANERYGIPFNAVYGPGAPDGIVLSEVLTQSGVLEALERARGAPSEM